MIRLTTAMAGLVLLSACTTADRLAEQIVGRTSLWNAKGIAYGTGVMTQDSQGLKLIVMVAGMAPGKIHGTHIHAAGKCEGPAFASAGPHLNPGARQHGSTNPAGSHLGDLPNLTIGSTGEGKLEYRLVGEPARLVAELFDADGSALVIHADADDYRTDPSGNSGARIACGVLIHSGS